MDKYTKEQLKRKELIRAIIKAKKFLADTDYKIVKHMEDPTYDITEIAQERSAARELINKSEEALRAK